LNYHSACDVVATTLYAKQPLSPLWSAGKSSPISNRANNTTMLKKTEFHATGCKNRKKQDWKNGLKTYGILGLKNKKL